MIRKGIVWVLVLVSLMGSMIQTASADTVGYVTSTGLNIRREPDASKDNVLRCATNGDKLTIIKTVGTWYYVKFNESVYGYVDKRYVSTSSSGSGSSSGSSAADENLPSKVSDLGDAPATSKKGDRNDHVKKLQQALKIMGYHAGKCDGIYGDGTVESVKKFQRAKGLTADGIAGKVTIKLIFGEDAANAGSSSGSGSGSGTTGTKTEILDWFKDKVSSIIPQGTYFTIKDVRTGSTFRAKHLFGANHMDAEPLTKDDTAKMKAIYGGVWSWDRRAILILCNGRVFAASMNGMPHGEQSIYDNSFDGQFCIHFVNSKTHGTSNVDPDHQYCITVAGKATW